MGEQDRGRTERLSPGQAAAAAKASQPTAVHALPTGATLFEYTVHSVLGCGGFGITYLAEDTNLNCKVALKEFFPGSLATRVHDQSVHPQASTLSESFMMGLEQFLDEARALATFRHPNIVRVLRFFEQNHTAYMVMEYEEGQSLHQWVRQHGQPDRTTALRLIHPLLNGLDAVHATGFLHRDIKPSNIFMRQNGNPVLLDFGSARNLKTAGGTSITAIVTPGYAPFEQYHSHGRLGPWSDLYSIGAVMYWMVTGEKPLEAPARIKSDPLPPASQIADKEKYGVTLLDAIDWALQPDQDRRPQSVTEFRRALPEGSTATTTIAKGSPISTFDRAVLTRAEEELKQFVGPLARVLVRQAAQSATDVKDLCQKLSKEIPAEDQQRLFLQRAATLWEMPRTMETPSTHTVTTGRAPSSKTVSPSSQLTEGELATVERKLARFIGPMAKVLIKQAAASATSLDDLYKRLADQLETPQDRQAFLSSRDDPPTIR